MSHGHMQQLNDGNIAMNMNIHQHHHSNGVTDHYDNVLNLNLSNDYHYGTDYWNSSYKNGSTPMKEMEGASGS